MEACFSKPKLSAISVFFIFISLSAVLCFRAYSYYEFRPILYIVVFLCHRIIVSSYHRIIVSSYPRITVSPYRHITESWYHRIIIFLHYYSIMLSVFPRRPDEPLATKTFDPIRHRRRIVSNAINTQARNRMKMSRDFVSMETHKGRSPTNRSE